MQPCAHLAGLLALECQRRGDPRGGGDPGGRHLRPQRDDEERYDRGADAEHPTVTLRTRLVRSRRLVGRHHAVAAARLDVVVGAQEFAPL